MERPIPHSTHNVLDNIRKISKLSLELDNFFRPHVFFEVLELAPSNMNS
jgi:hypothetical protein